MAEEPKTGRRSEPTTYNLLFVCTGNTCRSPMAVGLADRELRQRGWTHVSVRSAGIAAGAGAPASPEAIRVARDGGVDLSGHTSTPLSRDLVDWADLVLVMGPGHGAAVEDLGGAGKVALITEFGGGAVAGEPVDDPFGGGEDSYRRVWRQLEGAVEAVLLRLEPILSP